MIEKDAKRMIVNLDGNQKENYTYVDSFDASPRNSTEHTAQLWQFLVQNGYLKEDENEWRGGHFVLTEKAKQIIE